MRYLKRQQACEELEANESSSNIGDPDSVADPNDIMVNIGDSSNDNVREAVEILVALSQHSSSPVPEVVDEHVGSRDPSSSSPPKSPVPEVVDEHMGSRDPSPNGPPKSPVPVVVDEQVSSTVPSPSSPPKSPVPEPVASCSGEHSRYNLHVPKTRHIKGRLYLTSLLTPQNFFPKPPADDFDSD